jgi:hypothetical protein
MSSNSVPLDIEICPVVTGSLTGIAVDSDGIGEGYTKGDIVELTGLQGLGGKAIVLEVLNIAGLIIFEPVSYGYGYSNQANVLISESVFSVANLQPNSTPRHYWQLFETISQPKVAINYRSATGNLENSVGANLFTYHANNDQKGYGIIYAVDPANSTAGELKVFVYSGNLDSARIYTQANAIVANQAAANAYVNQYATANIMATSSERSLHLSNASGSFLVNEPLVAKDANNVVKGRATINTISNILGGNVTLDIENHFGFFGPNSTILGLTSNTSAFLSELEMDVAVIDITGAFVNNEFNYITGNVSTTNATIRFISTGLDASINVVTNNIIYTEAVNVNSDLIRDYFFTALAAVAYGFPANATANISNTFVADLLSYSSETVGKIVEITNINPGREYSVAPYVRVYDRLTAGVNNEDVILEIDGTPAGIFQIGEIVTQEATDARGIVKVNNSSGLFLERLRVVEHFIPTINSLTIIVGENSGAEANIVQQIVDQDTDAVGLNFDVTTKLKTGNGAISALQVIDSGFGYIDQETVTIFSNNNPSVSVEGIAILGKQGQGSGYYREKGGFLSDQKKLYDGYYYQEYSYEIRSSIALDKYKDIMRQVMHFAGTQMFGALLHQSKIEANTTIDKALVNIEPVDEWLFARDGGYVLDREGNPIIVYR